MSRFSFEPELKGLAVPNGMVDVIKAKERERWNQGEGLARHVTDSGNNGVGQSNLPEQLRVWRGSKARRAGARDGKSKPRIYSCGHAVLLTSKVIIHVK